ncbi:MAG: PIN domain-containing protein [Fimbriiglobus sp.]
MVLYLDVCCLQRPFDDQSQMRVRLEAEATIAFLSLCDAGGAELVSSDAIEYETAHNPNPIRREYVRTSVARAAVVVRLTADIGAEADRLVAAGLTPLDALHLACAAAAGADYFCTCDDRLLRRARVARPGPPKVVSPLELVTELNL